jgi:hypothetical protein
MIRTREGVRDLFTHVFSQGRGVSLAITHLSWIETDEMAIHQVEEAILPPPSDRPSPPPFYGTNIYRKDESGWRLIIHQNAPTPPPPQDFEMPE